MSSQVELPDPYYPAVAEPVAAAVRVEPGGGTTVLLTTQTAATQTAATQTAATQTAATQTAATQTAATQTAATQTAATQTAATGAEPAWIAGTGSRPVLPWALRVLLVGYGAFMSLWRLDVPSWNSDEMVYAFAGDAYWHGRFGDNPEHPPLGKWLIGGAEQLFGPSLWAVRLPAALAMLAGGVLLWVWLTRLIGPAAGCTAALLWWSLPALTTFPEALGHAGPDLGQAQRWALLDPLAAVLALAAVVAGWRWVRSGRLGAALCCGLLAGAAVATKLPAGLVVAVPAVIGPLATLAHPLPARLDRPQWTLLARLGRVAGHAAAWLAAGFGAFAAAYLPMGYHQAVATFGAGWRHQRLHGADGHQIALDGAVYGRSPWWSLAWWQYAAVGGAVAVVAIAAVAAGLALRSGLTAYLTATWLAPMLLLVPLTHLALPHYDLVWRPVLVAGCVAGGATAASWLRRRAHVVLAGAVVAVLAAPAAVLGLRTTAHTATARPAGYGALAALAGPGGAQVVGDVLVARHYLPGHPVQAVRVPPLADRPAPGTIVLDRASTLRTGDFGLASWARLHHYRFARSGTLEVWTRPAG